MKTHPEFIILKSLVGSHAYGLATDDSDKDWAGIFAEPSSSFHQLNYKSINETWTNASPNGDDETYHELAKFLNMCIKGNPNILEVLWAPIRISDTFGNVLITQRNYLFGYDLVRNNMQGFIRGTIHELKEAKNHHTDFKRFRTAYTKGRGIWHWLETGVYSFEGMTLEQSENLKKEPNNEIFIGLLEDIHEWLNTTDIHSSLSITPDVSRIERILESARSYYYN